jgi:hypothetical protein
MNSCFQHTSQNVSVNRTGSSEFMLPSVFMSMR